MGCRPSPVTRNIAPFFGFVNEQIVNFWKRSAVGPPAGNGAGSPARYIRRPKCRRSSASPPGNAPPGPLQSAGSWRRRARPSPPGPCAGSACQGGDRHCRALPGALFPGGQELSALRSALVGGGLRRGNGPLKWGLVSGTFQWYNNMKKYRQTGERHDQSLQRMGIHGAVVR